MSKCDLRLIYAVKVIQALNDDDNDLVMMFDQTYRHPRSNRTFTVSVDFQETCLFFPYDVEKQVNDRIHIAVMMQKRRRRKTTTRSRSNSNRGGGGGRRDKERVKRKTCGIPSKVRPLSCSVVVPQNSSEGNTSRKYGA